MEKFYINPKTLYSILKDKNVKNLYHANTVLTSLTFIQQRSLLSRGYVASHGLLQTNQASDEEDMRYKVWDDIFMDGMDIHKKYSTANDYGPVLFLIKLEVLLMPELSPLLVTKVNPWYWKRYPSWEERYFQEASEIKEKYLTGKMLDSNCMFTFRSPDKTIKLNKFLEEIIIDKPGYKIILQSSGEEKELGQAVYDRIRSTLDENGLRQVPIKFRHDGEKNIFCSCNFRYSKLKLTNKEEFIKRFKGLPKLP